MPSCIVLVGCGCPPGLLVLTGTAQQPLSPGALLSFSRFVGFDDSGDDSAVISLGGVNSDGILEVILSTGRHWESPNSLYFGDGKGHFRHAGALEVLPFVRECGSLVSGRSRTDIGDHDKRARPGRACTTWGVRCTSGSPARETRAAFPLRAVWSISANAASMLTRGAKDCLLLCLSLALLRHP